MSSPSPFSRFRLAATVWTVAVALQVRADSVSLRGGERLIGKLRTEGATTVVFESQTLGRIEIPREKIEKMELDANPPVPMPPPATAKSPAHASPLPGPSNSFRPWDTSVPASDRYDWIQLKSGEWLKGRMKSLQEDRIEFDSDKLDLQKFDWDDISTLHLPRPNAARFDTLGEATGSVLVTTNTVVVTGETTNSYPRSELISITPTGSKERNKWSGDISAGLSFRAGNTRQTDFNGQVEIDRRTPFTHLSLEYLGNLGRVNGEDTANNHRVTTEFDYFLSRRLFLITPFVEYYRDPLQNLEHRLTVGGGVGYDLIKNQRVEWNVTAGPAYQQNWYTSVSHGESDTPAAAAMVLGSKLEVELTKRLDFKAELRTQLTRREVGQTTYHGLAKLEFEIHKRLKLDLSFIWDRIAHPEPDANEVTPLKDDFRLITGLGLNF